MAIQIFKAPQQQDPLEKLANAVSIAKNVYGIYADSKTLDSALAQNSKKKELEDLQLQKAQREEEDYASDNDANSPIMVSIREATQKRGLTLPEGTTPKQARTNFDPFIKPKEEKVRDPMADELAALRLAEAKAKAALPAKKQQEFADRYHNINTQIGQIQKLVDEKGTYEMTGGHNEKLQQSIDSVAIDAAKLFDPESVARESEVAAFRNMLFEGGSLSKSNSTAKELLANFKGIIESRAANQYPNLLSNEPPTPGPRQTVLSGGKAIDHKNLDAEIDRMIEKKTSAARR